METISFETMAAPGSLTYAQTDPILAKADCQHTHLMEYFSPDAPAIGSPIVACMDCGTLFSTATMSNVGAVLTSDQLWAERQKYNELGNIFDFPQGDNSPPPAV